MRVVREVGDFYSLRAVPVHVTTIFFLSVSDSLLSCNEAFLFKNASMMYVQNSTRFEQGIISPTGSKKDMKKRFSTLDKVHLFGDTFLLVSYSGDF